MTIEAKKIYLILSEFVFPTIAIQFFWYLLCAFLLSGFSFYTTTFMWISSLIIVIITLAVIILAVPHTHTLKLRGSTLTAIHYFRSPARYNLNDYRADAMIERDKKGEESRGKKIILTHNTTRKKTEINCFPFEDQDFVELFKKIKESDI